MKTKATLISITVEQHERLKRLAKEDTRTMRSLLDIMMDRYENKGKKK